MKEDGRRRRVVLMVMGIRNILITRRKTETVWDERKLYPEVYENVVVSRAIRSKLVYFFGKL